MSDFKQLNGYNVKDDYARARLDANNGGTWVNIIPAGADTSKLPFTFPSDGYLKIYGTYISGHSPTAIIAGSNNVEITRLSNYQGVTNNSLFVKKGMKVSSISDFASNSYLYFTPLI